MDELAKLVLASSLPLPNTSLNHWELANQLAPIEDWPGEISRLVSCFYANHGKDVKLSNHAILKGVYKSNWSRNSLSLASLIPILLRFDQSHIDYRLVKGAAIVLYLGQLGARRMGDLDIVVSHKNRNEVTEILLNEGFYPRYLGDKRGELNQIWENLHGIILDLHFLRLFDFYSVAFEKCVERSFLDYNFKLPSFESSILIALNHGVLGHSRGDLAQALWDVSMIYHDASADTLNSMAIKMGCVQILENQISYLNSLGMSFNYSPSMNVYRNLMGMLGMKFKTFLKLTSPKTYPRIFNAKSVTIRALMNALCVRHDIKYICWALFGMIRPLERFLIVKTGGLLPNKSLEYQNKCVIDLTPGCWYYEGGNFTVRSYFDSEIRVQLANPATVNSKLEIELDMYSFYPRMLFIDGIGHGHLAMTSGREYGFELKTPSDKIEISLRDFALQPIPWQGRIIFKWSTRNSF